MSWFMIARTDLKTGDMVRMYCYQKEGDPKQYKEISEEALEELLECFLEPEEEAVEPMLRPPVEEAPEEPVAPFNFLESHPTVAASNTEAPVQNNTAVAGAEALKQRQHTLKNLMAASKGIIDEDGAQQG